MSQERELHVAASTAADEEQELADAGVAEELLARRREALKQVRQFGDPILRSTARPVDDFDDDLAIEAQRMVTLMHEALGVGLAAPQVGSSRRLLVYQVGDQRPRAVINPTIEWSSDDEEPHIEGCLSIPGVEVEVSRPIFVRVRAQNVQGDAFEIEASGLEARVLQHEIDHLDGVLTLDRTSRDERKAALKALREAEAGSGYAA